jgi:hypothetical protein
MTKSEKEETIEDVMARMEYATIAGLSGHPMSGLWMLEFEDAPPVYIGSGYGVRQLAACFGATEGSGDILEKIKGKRIRFTRDFIGEIEGFSPVDADGNVIEE